MADVMVTGRMPADKKAAGNAVLEKAGLNASQAINLVYDRLAESQSADFLTRNPATDADWKRAAKLIDSIAAPAPIRTRFDDMTRGELKLARAQTRKAL